MYEKNDIETKLQIVKNELNELDERIANDTRKRDFLNGKYEVYEEILEELKEKK